MPIISHDIYYYIQMLVNRLFFFFFLLEENPVIWILLHLEV